MKLVLVFLSALVISLSSCSKDSGGSNTGNAPTNLVVSATVNPDNSGNVAFTASATDAVTYDFDFGNGSFQSAASGSYTYKYPASGSYTVTISAKSAGGQSISKTLPVTVTVVLALVWSDEFSTNGAPDATKWGYDLGAGGWGNNELQYYTNRPENARVENGLLKITLTKESYLGSPFTSSRLLSKDKYSFKYGRIEVKAKLPTGRGTWPAIWMLGSNISSTPWPACGEIDIMEHVGREQNKIFSTLHYPNFSGGNGVSRSTMIPTASTEFHVYSAEWSPSSIQFSVDGQVFHTFSNISSFPFNQNFFIILNVAMGGNFGGDVDFSYSTGSMDIDYVRVYQ